ncbi:MAG TPA: sigma-70 family RNA polymerase sigma factor [Gemmataceae bacterium]|jgi:RNA polymerase sigma factor (sigma-70 family)
MSTSTVGLYLRHLALSEEVNRLGSASDHDLLATYELERGQAAFTELMRRHGPMVLRTCRRVLGHGPDAEDAFQAAFVLLARKAGQLRRGAAGRQSLGGWLHRVAYQTAVNVLSQSARRRARERQAGAMTHPDPDPVREATWNEVRPILDAELDALPDEARRLLIACYLQDKTHAEAAAELGLPLGSVAWRLEKARALLEERLVRRGIAVSASLLALLLGESAKGAGVPAVLLVHTVEAARTFTEQANGMVSDNVARLMKGGLAQMTKGSTHLSVALAGWLGLLGVGLIACQTLKAWPDRAPESEPAAAERPAQDGSKPVRTDRYGDPLPPSALARLGTMRFRGVVGGQMSIVFTQDGKGVITAGQEGPPRLWEVPTGKLIRQLAGSSRQRVHAIALSPDGRLLAGRGGPDGGFRLWHIATGKLLAEGKGESADLVSLAFSPDGKRVASGGNDNTLRLWDAATGQEQWVQANDSGAISAVAFSPDGKTLAAVETKTLSFWDAATGKRKSRQWDQERPLSHAAFTPDGRTLAVVCGPLPKAKKQESVVCLIDVATCKEVRQLASQKEEGGMDAFHSLALAPSGKVLATATSSGKVRLWDIKTGKELCHCQGERNAAASALVFSADGKMLAGVDGVLVRLWETRSGKEVSSVRGGHRREVSSVAFTPDGGTLVSSSWDGSVRLWNPATGEQRQQIAPAGGDLEEYQLASEAAAVAPDGKTLTLVDVAWPVKGGPFGAVIRLWDRDAGRERSRCFHKLGEQLGNMLVLSPDGKTVAGIRSNAFDEVQLWESATGKLLSKIAGKNPAFPAFSPDGKLLATAHSEPNKPGTVTLWETATGKEVCSVALPEWPVSRLAYRLAFSPDGRMLATASDVASHTKKHTIHLWPLLKDESRKSGSALGLGPPRVLAEGLSFYLWALVFSPDGRMLALPDEGGVVRVLETATGKERLRVTGHSGEVRALTFSPDGRRLASGSFDTTVLIWDVTGRFQDGRLRPVQLSDKEQEKLWTDLADDDAGRAGRSLWTLAAAPAQTVPLLAKRLRPASARVAPEVIAKLIRDLDDDAFTVRLKARKELQKLGADAEPALCLALAKSPSLEVRRQVEELLAAVAAQRKRPSGEVLRNLRAVEVLEQIGNRDARQVLKTLAAGAAGATLTQEADAALARLERAERR